MRLIELSRRSTNSDGNFLKTGKERGRRGL